MGDALTCEYGDPGGSGDVLQQTTTGLAVYREGTNTPEFTDGWNHWALTGQGVVTWSGAQAAAAAPPSQSQQSAACTDVGAGLCFSAAAELGDTVTLLAKTGVAQPLLRNAAKDGYSVRYGNLPPDVLGLFRPSRHEIVISMDLRRYSAMDRGPVLAHELQHVSDWITQGQQLDTTAGCLATETSAFHTESAAWLELRGGRLAPPSNDLEQEFNAITRALQTDPTGFANRLTLLYHDECTGQ